MVVVKEEEEVLTAIVDINLHWAWKNEKEKATKIARTLKYHPHGLWLYSMATLR